MLNKTIKTLTTEEIAKNAPAVYTINRCPSRSEKYLFISTSQLINVLLQSGWVVVRADNAGRKGKKKYALHAVCLTRPEYLENTDSNLVPLLRVVNSHNGKHKFSIKPAIMSRKSGQVYNVPQGIYPAPSIVHRTYNVQEVLSVSYTILNDFPKVLRKVDSLRNTKLSANKAKDFAQAAAKIIFNADDILRTDEYLGEAKVAEQLAGFEFNRESSVWDLIESINENAFNGGVQLKRKKGKITKARKIKSLKRHDDITQKILELSKEYLEEKQLENPYAQLEELMGQVA